MDGNKRFYHSKKFLAYLLLVLTSTAVILSSLLTGQSETVSVEALRTLGFAVGAASSMLIGGQSFVDGKIAGRRDD